MAGFEEASVGPYLAEQLQNLMEHGMDESCRILGDMFLFNCSVLGIPDYSVHKRNLLVSYGDSLFRDKQYNRALFYFQQALDIEPQHTSGPEGEDINSKDTDIKWKLHCCYLELKQHQEALDILSSIPMKNRSTKITLSLAKLYHHFKKDKNTAMAYYRMVLKESPFAIEAALALLSFGTPLSQVEMILKQHPRSIISLGWLQLWLKVQAYIANFQYTDAVREFQALTAMGLNPSPEMNSQMGWCMAKLTRKSAALELFKLARNKDPYQLSHADTFARLLTNKTGLPNSAQLADTLLGTSSIHVEPWVAKLWSVVRKSTWKDGALDSPSVTVLINKLSKMEEPDRGIGSEGEFLLGAISTARQSYEDAIAHYQSAIRSDPSFFEAYESILRCYLLSRGFKTAFSTMKMAIKFIKIPSQRLYLEGFVLANKPEFRARAKICLESAIKEDPTFEKAPVSLSIIYRQEKQPTKAVELLKQVLQLYQSAGLHVELARSLIQMKKYTEAMQHFEAAIRLEPEHKDAVQGLQEIESLLQGGAEEEQEDEGREGGRGERDRGRVYDEEEENKMEDSEEVLVFGPGENLEGAREFGDSIAPLVDFDDEDEY